MSPADDELAHAEALTVPDIRQLRAVFFDFDGVILESAAIKEEAFRHVFAEWPQHLDRIVQHHHDYLGHSRFEKFSWIYREILQQQLSVNESTALGNRFSRFVRQRMLACPMTPGAVAFLDRLRGRVDCFVVSGTPHAELEELITKRDLQPYFREIWGSPRSKATIFRDILDRHDFAADQVLAIGDGKSDYDAACSVGVAFVARKAPSSAQDWSTTSVPVVDHLGELLAPLDLRAGGSTAKSRLR
ncbi:MAG: HAD hydrolase-like protein [Acidobacteriota bacterium]|nr:HAD hydrolase-like protein [Acidobacteriota bacterium]